MGHLTSTRTQPAQNPDPHAWVWVLLSLGMVTYGLCGYKNPQVLVHGYHNCIKFRSTHHTYTLNNYVQCVTWCTRTWRAAFATKLKRQEKWKPIEARGIGVTLAARAAYTNCPCAICGFLGAKAKRAGVADTTALAGFTSISLTCGCDHGGWRPPRLGLNPPRQP